MLVRERGHGDDLENQHGADRAFLPIHTDGIGRGPGEFTLTDHHFP